jgi:hypothetical protein
VTAQLDLATPLVAKATELSRWVTWLAPRFGAFGGTLAEEVASLTGYQQLVDRDGAHLNAQIAAARGLLGAGPDEDLYAALAGVRDAVYTLAWDVDLGYAAYFGGWPHHRLGAVAQAVQESGSAHLSFEASGPVRRIATDTDSVYAVVVGLLDIALGVVDAEVPGYGGRDSAQSWGAPEVAGARTEVAALIQLGAQWAAQQPFDEADEAALEQATQASFGIAHESFRQIAADFQ